MFTSFLVLGGIVLAVLIGSIVLMTVTQMKRNKAAAAGAPAPQPQPEPEVQSQPQPVVPVVPVVQPVVQQQVVVVPVVVQTAAPAPVPADEDDDDDIDDEEDIAAAEEGGYDRRGRIMFVKDMSPAMRLMIGVMSPVYDERQYRVTFSYSFKARLALADDEMKEFYADYFAETARFKKVRLRESRRHVRIGIGRDKVGVLFFKGKKLCVAYALSPEDVDYEAFKLEDISDKKRFAETPALLRFTSGMKCRRAKLLLNDIAAKYGLKRMDDPASEAEIPNATRDELIRDREIRIYATLVARAPAEEAEKTDEEESKADAEQKA